ncbi:MAG TPA: PIN domain nuclease [Thiomonas arsenitoxydans]|jgi:predicted nucleic acid-binding protein|uniref:type II toxin-antitoxin system VapC family toxin n=1 Tax=Thiomonas sp. TaxID=2047785 RepID=UPI000BD7CEA7|nr:PIN domain nuclease [Thiomonas sp.]OZB72826.1 MAG: VapC toxin family PIN domain ribonuclease [Thiomonas sp. 14-64-326]HOI65500.1 PIN domain nuclease [Thiomonas arsenitoxydans]
MILVDSSVWIDFFNGRATPRVANLALLLDDMAPVAVADLVLFEVLRGFRHERDYLAARKTLTALTVVEIGGEDNALQAAQHDRLLRAMGYTIRSAVDMLQAAYCIEHDYALLHNDADFDVMEDLRGLKVWRH